MLYLRHVTRGRLVGTLAAAHSLSTPNVTMMFAAVAGLAVFVPDPLACIMTCVGASATKRRFFLPTCTCLLKYAGDLRFCRVADQNYGKSSHDFWGKRLSYSRICMSGRGWMGGSRAGLDGEYQGCTGGRTTANCSRHPAVCK